MQKMWGKSVINSNAQFRSSAVAVAAACSKGSSSSADLSVEVGSCLRLVSNPLVEKDPQGVGEEKQVDDCHNCKARPTSWLGLDPLSVEAEEVIRLGKQPGVDFGSHEEELKRHIMFLESRNGGAADRQAVKYGEG